MRSPRGFGKNYFTLSSILAHSVQKTISDKISVIKVLLLKKGFHKSDDLFENEEDPPLEILTPLCVLGVKACHCRRFDELKARLALLNYLFIPRCPYYTTYFAFRRSGVHPPLSFYRTN